MPTIILTRLGSEDHESSELPRQCAWPISVTAVGEDMPSAIFVYHVGDSLQGDIFEAVASPLQLEELPSGKSVPGIPYYRSSRLDFFCRSAEEAAYVWDTVKEEVEFLVRDYNAGLLLAEQEQISISSTAVEPTPDIVLQQMISGNGSPEGHVSAPVDTWYRDRLTQNIWVKTSGDDVTGWTALIKS